MKSIKKEVAEMLAEKLEAYAGCEIYGADLAFTLLECENVDGSITYSRYAAEEWIKVHFGELGEIVEQMSNEWEYNGGADIFDNPEKFMTSVYLWVASEICGGLDSVAEFWNDCEALTSQRIEAITAELEQIAQ